MNPKSTIVVCLSALIVVGTWIVWMFVKAGRDLETSKLGGREVDVIEAHLQQLSAPAVPRSKMSDDEVTAMVTAMVSEKARTALADALIERLVRMMLANKRAAIEGEAVLTFADDAAFEEFVAKLRGSGSPIDLLGMLDTLRAVRLGYDDLEDLRALLAGLEDTAIEIAANFVVRIPFYPIPDPGAPLPGAGVGAPFRNTALRFLGITRGQNAEWGAGVTVAVLDSGVAEHPTFREGQVRHIGEPPDVAVTEPGENVVVDGHGTAVASIIGGSDPRAPGVAPQVDILSFQLLDANGSSDSFTLAQMIFDAVQAGADVINLSVGSYGNSQLVHDMVDYATQNSRLIVASTGNDAAESIVYPAAYEDVIAVAASDAQGEHLEFSNASEQVDLAAPGLAVDAAWPNGQLVEFSGTSASAPFVAGAIAAVMSENPSLTALQAWALLQQFTNEAGAPGEDPELGKGNLNLGRLMERDQPGIYDIAVTSHHYDPALTEPGDLPSVQVTVQNRGTEALANFNLNVTSGALQRDFFIPILRPGQIATHEIPLDLRRATIDGQVEISSVAQLARSNPDRSPADNSLRSTISVAAPETAAK